MVDQLNTVNKPPLGIMPEHLWKEMRIWNLIECIDRNQGHIPIHHKWVSELKRLLNDMKIYTQEQDGYNTDKEQADLAAVKVSVNAIDGGGIHA